MGNFCDYIPTDEERRRFRDNIGESGVGTETSEMLHVRLRDAHRRELTVKICYTCFTDQDGKNGHLIGICEVEERAALDPGAEDTFEQLGVLPTVIGCRTCSHCSTGSASSESASETDADALKCFDEDMDEMAIVICNYDNDDSDDDSSDFIVVSYTPNFSLLSGPVPEGQKFIDWLPEDEHNRFLAHMQCLDNYVRAPYKKLKLCTRSQKQAKMGYVVEQCVFSSITLDADTDVVYYKIVLTGVSTIGLTKTKKRKKRKSSKSNKALRESAQLGDKILTSWPTGASSVRLDVTPTTL